MRDETPLIKQGVLSLTIGALKEFYPHFLDLAIPELRGRFNV
jgi:hypothetical protein